MSWNNSGSISKDYQYGYRSLVSRSSGFRKLLKFYHKHWDIIGSVLSKHVELIIKIYEKTSKLSGKRR